MTRDFEKQFPLPFKWHVFDEKASAKPKTLTVYADNGHYVFSSRIQNRFDVFSYMVQCANLMPEAIKLIKEGLKKKMETCAMCDDAPDHEECSTCPLNARIAEAKAFLAKFEKEPE